MQPETLYVRDNCANAKEPVRVHQQMVNGEMKDFTFKAGEALQLPFAIAVKFLKDGFTVMDEKNREYDKRPDVNAAMAPALAEDEVVANLEELTHEALIIRCNQMPGGEKYKKSNKKPELIEFLVAQAAGGKVSVASEGEGADAPDAAEPEEMDDDEVNAIFGPDEG